jgi:hypothetical protein
VLIKKLIVYGIGIAVVTWGVLLLALGQIGSGVPVIGWSILGMMVAVRRVEAKA